MKHEIDHLSFDEIEDFGDDQIGSIWGHAPSVDPNVLTVEEIMGKTKEKKPEAPAPVPEENPIAIDTAPTKEIHLNDYTDISSSEMSDAAQMLIDKMRAAEVKKQTEQPAEKPAAFTVTIPEDEFSAPIDLEAVKAAIDGPAVPEEVPVEAEEEKPQEEFELQINMDDIFPDATTESEPQVEEPTVAEQEPEPEEVEPTVVKQPETFDGNMTNIFNTHISPSETTDEDQPEPEEEEDDDPKEFIDDRDAMFDAFLAQRRSLRIQSVCTGIIAAALFVIALFQLIPLTSPLYYIVTGALLLVAMLINYKIMASLRTLFYKIPNADCSPALAAVFSLIQIIVCFLFKDSLGDAVGYLSMFGGAACVSMFCATLGKISITKRILANLKLLDRDTVHNAAVFIAPPYSAKLADVQEIGETLICARRKAVDLKGFMHYSLALDPYETSYGLTLIISVALALLSGLVYGLVASTVVGGITLATAVFCLFAPFSTLIINGLGISSICKRLRVKGAMLSGYAAAEEISNANVIELEAGELFDSDSVKLYNFKTFDNYPFTQAIADAAAITQAVSSPLAGMFNKIVITNKTILPGVDNVEYEEKMGVTGWVDEKKTIIGNRMIMESHNIPVPPLSFDRQIIQSGKFPVYLASDGQLTAVFIVGYSVKRQMVMRIRKLVNTGVTILVRTTDPNVSTELICNKYGVPTDSVVIMTSSAAHYYQEITAQSEVEPAMLVSRNVRGFIDAYIQSLGAKQTTAIASALLFIGCIVCAILGIVLTFLQYSNLVSMISVTVVHILAFAIVAFINMLRS